MLKIQNKLSVDQESLFDQENKREMEDFKKLELNSSKNVCASV